MRKRKSVDELFVISNKDDGTIFKFYELLNKLQKKKEETGE